MAPPKRPPEGARWIIPDWNPYASDEEARVKTYLDQVEELRQELAAARERIEQIETLNLSLHGELEQVGKDEKLLAYAQKLVADTGRLSAQLKARDECISRLEEQAEGYKTEIALLNERLAPVQPKETKTAWWLWVLLSPILLIALPFIAVYLYITDEKFREPTNNNLKYAIPITLAYFIVVSLAVNFKDDQKPCFRSGGSFFYCGAVRGVWRPLKAGGAWLVGWNEPSKFEIHTGNAAEANGADTAWNQHIRSAADGDSNAQTEAALEAAADAEHFTRRRGR